MRLRLILFCSRFVHTIAAPTRHSKCLVGGVCRSCQTVRPGAARTLSSCNLFYVLRESTLFVPGLNEAADGTVDIVS